MAAGALGPCYVEARLERRQGSRVFWEAELVFSLHPAFGKQVGVLGLYIDWMLAE